MEESVILPTHSHFIGNPLREEILELLRRNLSGRNLYDLARMLGVATHVGGKLNKGWVGQTIERAAGLRNSSRQAPDGEDFELKSTTLIPNGDSWLVRETIKITQFSPEAVLEESFESSSLWRKLSRLILVGCAHPDEGHAYAVRIEAFDVDDPEWIEALRNFWEETRRILLVGEMRTYDSKGSSEGFLQLRPTGNRLTSSRCPITGELFQAKAYYATKPFVRKLLKIDGSTTQKAVLPSKN